MKKYFVRHNNFGNNYNLYHAETQKELAALPPDVEQITRMEAEKLALSEQQRLKDNPNFSGYADYMIFPADYDRSTESWENQPEKFIVGRYIIERKREVVK